MLTSKKRFLFTGITLFLFFSTIAIVEILLRIVAPNLENPLIKQTTYNGRDAYEVNTDYLKKYFPVGSPIIPGIKPTIFSKQKTDNVFRIVCLGSSSMFGTPYQLTTNIASIVRKQLHHIYPDKKFEIINLGASAINSNVVLDISKKIIDYDPDLVLVYMGHNEFYGPDGVGASWIQKEFPATIPWKYEFQDLRLIQAVDRYVLASPKNIPTSDMNLMKQVSQKNTVSLHSAAADRIFNLFESNLNDIISLFSKHNIPIIISDLTSNLMFPPFVYDTSAQLQPYSSQLQMIKEDYEKKDFAPALTAAQHLYLLDSTNAFLNFWMGKIYLANNNFNDAKYFLTRARDEDLLKFRAPSKINEIIKRVAQKRNVPFISADSLFSSLSATGIAGDDLFREHLHPNARGYYEIASLFVKEIIKQCIVSPQNTQSNNLLPFNEDSLGLPWLDLAYGDISIRQLTKQWPFQEYKPQMFVMTHDADSVLKQIALDIYTYRTSLTEGCYNTALRFRQLHQYQKALTTYASLIDDYPDLYYPYYLSGAVYKDMGNLKQAAQYYEISIHLNPEYLFARIDLGLVDINEGKIDEAIVHLDTAKRLAEKEHASPLILASIYYGLGGAYANKGDIQHALSLMDQTLRLAPNYQAAHILRNNLLRYKK